MTPRIARWLAWFLVAIYFILSATGVYLQALTNTTPGNIAIPLLPYFFVVILVGIWPIIGAKIISHHPRHPVGWLLFATFSMVAIVMFAIGYASYAASLAPDLLPLPGVILFWLKGPGLPTTIVALTLMYLLFPTGKLFSPRWQMVAWANIGAFPIIIGLLMVIPGPLSLFPGLENPDAVSEPVWASLSPLYLAMIALLTMCNLAAITSLFLRMRHKKGDEVQQVKWLMIPAIVYWSGIPANYLGNFEPSGMLLNLGVGLHLISVPAIVIAVAFAIFKYRLYDIDFLINRTLVYGILTACVVGLYVLVVGGASMVIQSQYQLVAMLITGMLVWVVYRPMHAFIQRSIDRLLPGSANAALTSHRDEMPPQLVSITPSETDAIRSDVRQMLLIILAWLLVAVYFALAGTGLFLGILTNASVGDFPIIWFILLMIVIGIWPVMGARIINRHPRHPVGWLLFAAFPLAATDLFTIGYASYVTLLYPGSQPIPGLMLTWLNWSAQPFVLVAFTLLNLYFPTGQFLSPRWRMVAWICAGTLPIYLTLLFFEPGPLELLPRLNNPYAVSETIWAMLEPFYFMLGTIFLLCGLASIVCLFQRLHGSRRDERQQLKWLVFPAILYWISQPFGFLAKYEPNGIFLATGVILVLISVPMMVIVIAMTIFKYRLYNVNLLINRTLVYGALTISVVAIYGLSVGALGTFFQAQGNLIIALLATGLVAVLFQPLRERLQRGINRLIYGERDDPVEVLSRLGRSLETALPSDKVLPALVETIAQTLKLPFTGIAIQGQIVAAYGKPPENPVPFPLVFQGEPTGELLAAPRSPDESFTPSEMRLLRNLARQAGAAVRNAQLTADLQRSRQNLVTTREEERHRLRRDLHDGIGPSMAGLTLKLDAAKDLIASSLETGETTSLEEALQLLTQLKFQTQETVQEVRRIVHDLRPPSLDVLGLAPVLQALFGQVAAPANLSIHLTTTPKDFPRLSATVEVAAYRIVLEAVTNVICHAKANVCQVSLALENGHLQLTVTDNGQGISKNHSFGVGLNSMRERAEELGGRFELNSSPKGTRICAKIPVL